MKFNEKVILEFNERELNTIFCAIDILKEAQTDKEVIKTCEGIIDQVEKALSVF